MSDERQQHAPRAATPDSSLAATFSDGEWQALVALRTSYEHAYDLLSVHEQARLRFLRWLVDTGRLES